MHPLRYTNSFEKGILKTRETRETREIRGIVLRKKNIFALIGCSRKFNNDYVNGSDITPHFCAANGTNFSLFKFSSESNDLTRRIYQHGLPEESFISVCSWVCLFC